MAARSTSPKLCTKEFSASSLLKPKPIRNSIFSIDVILDDVIEVSNVEVSNIELDGLVSVGSGGVEVLVLDETATFRSINIDVRSIVR